MSDIESTLTWIDEQARYLTGPNMGRLVRLANAYRAQARRIAELEAGLPGTGAGVTPENATDAARPQPTLDPPAAHP